MTNKEKKDWLSVQYPLTVLCDRYDGTYSGAKWLAFPLGYDKIPSGIDASDPECAQFWKDYKEPVGKGAYASDAVTDLIRQMRESEPEKSEDERIRQSLLAYIKGESKRLDTKKWIAYLEKQKEHQNNPDAPKEKSVGGNFLSSHKDKNLDEIAQDYVDGVKEYNSEPTWDLMQTAVCYGYHYREQKEQKQKIKIRIPKFRVGDIIQRVPLERWDSSVKITSIDEYGYNYNLSHLGDNVSGGAIGFAFESEYELVEQKPADLPAGFYFIDQDGNKYYSKEFRYNNGTFTTTMKVMEEQKPVEGKEYTSPDCGTSACCDDERFEIIAQAKRDIIEKTNIAENELSMELPLLDGILMRVWQVGWLNKKPAEWSEKDEKNLELVIDCVYEFYPDPVMKYKLKDWLTQRLKSLRPQPRKEIYLGAKHDLAIKFMNYLDENRPEGKMSLSNGECEDIDKAFKENDWAKIMRYIEKYSPHWKPSEEQMEALASAVKLYKDTHYEIYHERIVSLYEQLKKLI